MNNTDIKPGNDILFPVNREAFYMWTGMKNDRTDTNHLDYRRWVDASGGEREPVAYPYRDHNAFQIRNFRLHPDDESSTNFTYTDKWDWLYKPI